MKWYVALLSMQVILLSAIMFLGFASTVYDLLFESAMDLKVYRTYHMTYGEYLAVNITTTIGSLIILCGSVFSLLKKKEKLALIFAGIFFLLTSGLFTYSLYFVN
jgi:uncharacterized membrane protein YjjB (DUF3815 family)